MSQLARCDHAQAAPTVFAIHFSPGPEHPSLVRQFVLDFFGCTAADPQLISQVSVAAHELLENALKYAAQGETGLRIEVLKTQVVLQTWNKAPHDRVRALEQAFLELKSEPDPMRFYLSCMRKTARQAEGSGLGFARIRAECGMDLELEIQGENVVITATTTALEKEVKR